MMLVSSLSSSSLSRLALLLLLVSSSASQTCASGTGHVKEGLLLDVGPLDRFWRHHVTEEMLMYEGVNYYHTIRTCLDDSLTEEEKLEATTSTSIGTRKAGSMIYDPIEETPMLVVVKNAMLPIHVKSIQALAKCLRKHLPHTYESRAMYKEFNLDEDRGLGGNCPTHLAPLVGVFLPHVREEMYRTLQTAYDAAGWKSIVDVEQLDEDLDRQVTLFPPRDVGMRASEHLTYKDFPGLGEHNDGHTSYTMNFAFAGPEDYEGGEFFILAENKDGTEFRRFVKPNKYEALVFLGGRYMHGVSEIWGGNREMFSTEFWPYPDSPFGSSLWSNYPENMESYIKRCNAEREAGNAGPCKAGFKLGAWFTDEKFAGKVMTQEEDEEEEEEEEDDEDDLLDNGPLDRFWRHHVTEETLMYEGVNYYHTIRSCIDDSLTEEERLEATTSTSNAARKAGTMIYDPTKEKPMLVVVENALLPIHVKSVQALAACLRKYLPDTYESRAMFEEMNLDEDKGFGGNCPTHLAPLVGVFLPQVREEMYRTLQTAYEAAGWKSIVDVEQLDEDLDRQVTLFPPREVGMRASEHLTYKDFPGLAAHDDGDTAYTMNFAFAGPEDYEGGEFVILSKNEDGTEFRRSVKPNKYEAMVFLGGRYRHGVRKIRGGNREMFSTEFWPYPDAPFGSSLWSNFPENMEDYIKRCNAERKAGNDGPCKADFKLQTYFDYIANKKRKQEEDGEEEDEDGSYNYDKMGRKLPPPVHEGIDRKKDHTTRPNRIKPSYLTTAHVIYRDDEGNLFDSRDFKNRASEPDFLIPNKLAPGEMHPIRWREDRSPIDGPDGESFVVGFPPELHEEFLKYVTESGMMKLAYDLLYKETPLIPEEQRIYTLDDGEKWTAMVQGSWKSDMIWLDPGDESAFESVLGVLRRGGFDVVLDSVGRTFDLQGLMIQGIGAIFLSKYDYTENVHVDIVGSRGSFYNIIVPVHIPENDVAIFKLADADEDDDTLGSIKLDPSFGVVLGGESRHGTGECDYRKNGGFRLSFAVYVADINDKNVGLMSSDSTSLWPTQDDTDWFLAQKARLWSKDGKNSLKYDKGRKPLNVQDNDEDCLEHKDLCDTDLQGKRLECAKTCQLYLVDEKYYAKFFPGRHDPNTFPSCASSDEPSCKDQTKQHNGKTQ